MIHGIGIDIIATKRMQKKLDDEDFLRRVFTPAELAYCLQKSKAEQFLAARFSAKEAFMKALGTGWGGGVDFNQIEVIHLEEGQPALQLNGVAEQRLKKLKGRTHLSMTHIEDMAAAIVLIELHTDDKSKNICQ